MTTIAYNHKDKEIAIDSRVTGANVILSDQFNKVLKNDIGIWFLCGSFSAHADLVCLKHNDRVEVAPDCSALLIKQDGETFYVYVDDGGYCGYARLAYDFALGSGGNFAVAAMDHGKSAKEAVKYAMTRDMYTGGRVRVFKVK